MLFSRIAAVSAWALCLSISVAQAQTRISPERLQALNAKLGNVKNEAIGKLPPQAKALLSGGALNYLKLAEAWNHSQSGGGPDFGPLANMLNPPGRLQTTPAITSYGPVPVSNPASDFLFSVMAGFTQSETSTAWCGSNVVTGFNDSGSLLESTLFGPGGASFSGAAASTNGGYSFRDIGFINPGSDVNTFLIGDPVVNCADASTFYYSQIANGGSFATGPTAGVVVSKSSDGGFAWGDPVAAVTKDAFTHAIDKDWSALDQKHPRNIYVSYTDFDFTGFSAPVGAVCPLDIRYAIEIVHSTDGGITWSSPTVVNQVCGAIGALQSSQIVVDSKGRVYVGWEYFGNSVNGLGRELRIARSGDKAVSFQPIHKVADAIPTGDGSVLQGGIRSGVNGSLAVDRSGTNSDGMLYVTWEDGRYLSRPDAEALGGLYRYASVLLSSSTDGGKTWSAPTRVNNDALQSSQGSGIDHYQPGVAVDSTGAVAACWYDRRDSGLNYMVSRYCGTSTDFGVTWSNTRVDPRMWLPIHATDVFINTIYLGDYDTVANDKLNQSTGFLGSYGNVTINTLVPNQDVFLTHLRP